MSAQIERLQTACARVFTSNEQGVRYAGQLLRERTPAEAVGDALPHVSLASLTQPLAAINVGLASFAESLQAQNASVIQVELAATGRRQRTPGRHPRPHAGMISDFGSGDFGFRIAQQNHKLRRYLLHYLLLHYSLLLTFLVSLRPTRNPEPGTRNSEPGTPQGPHHEHRPGQS